ncbi:MAG: hypothetical protein U0002_04915 [Thermoanaerobaculia bacterium]
MLEKWMNARCPREEELLATLSLAGPGPEQETHLAACAACQEAVRTARALQEGARALHRQANLPPASVVLLKARIRAREEALERSLRPVVWWQRVATALAVGVATAGAWGMLQGAQAAATAGAAASPAPPLQLLLALGLGALALAPLLAGGREVA